ncbi:ATPase [bacterium (Candidatus Howlettbacteria) CG23_combo_of_CG06-09_8_20_14_all_37_9]|nr:MAG: ATPase [bacterium (Candidatus Howlettbacteria) CG23_combo_of_CG06-09_8_20_14_all_37_9]
MIKRNLLSDLNKHLESKEITLITGPRQAGKTTIMLELKKNLENEGKKTLFLNLDIEADRRFFNSQEDLIRKIKLELGESQGFVFIDEMQRKEDAGLFLKGIYDMNLPYKLIVSGSGSIELKEKIHESLSGRKRIFELSTITFEEFVNYRTDYKYENRLNNFLEIESEKTAHFLKEYLNFGGYPKVILAETIEEKQKIIAEIYQSYLEKDISYLLGIQKTEAFTNLVKALSHQVGNLINYSELSSTAQLSEKTVKNYLWYLEKTFVLERVTPFFKNPRKEITKSPMVYFEDLGLRNYSAGVFGRVEETSNLGSLFENLIFFLLKDKIYFSPANIHFWRTKDGAEVDFVIDTHKQLPIEVKYQSLKCPEMTRSFRNYIEKYKPEKAYIINLSLKEMETLNTTIVYFIPFYEFLGHQL